MQPLIVTAAVIRDGDAILITRRPPESRHGKMWEFPGGKLHPDETPQECLKREIREELGLDAAVGSIFEVAYHRYEWGTVLILAFECLLESGEIRHIGISEHRWVLPQEMSLYDILPADRPIIEKLLKSA